MDRTEEQIAKEKEAVESMRNAKSNMDKTLARVSTLETALKTAADRIANLAAFLPDNAYPYSQNETKHSLRAIAKQYEASARSAL